MNTPSSAPTGQRTWKPRTWPGEPDSIRSARRWVADTVLVHEQAPTRIRDQVRLIVSELATNTIRHTDSGRDGEFTVRVATAPGWARVEVIDQGGETIPTARPRPVALAESGHGLWLVQALTHTWGTLDHGARGAVFAEWIWDPEAGRDDGAH